MLKDEIKAKGDCLKILYITFIFILVVIIEFKFSYKKIKINDKISNSNIIDYNNNIDNNNIDMNLFNKKIEENYKKQGFVNLNEIESKILNGRAWMQNSDKNNVINFGFQLDHLYVSRAMITLASIMSSQNNSTLIKFHFAIVLNFTISDMLKIYTLRKRLREDVEFIFYNASRVETELDGLNKKGPGAVAKLLLPQLLPDDIDRLLIFDTGDLLVIKDLSPAYNWDMKGCLYAGVPGFGIGLGIKTGFRMNGGNPSSSIYRTGILEAFVVIWCYFFLKCLVEFTDELSGPGDFCFLFSVLKILFVGF